MAFQGKRILLIISGGIAAYKALELIRGLKARGASVRAIMTDAAHHFVTPLSVSVLCEQEVHTELFNLKDEAAIGHIRLARETDLIIIAPSTAHILARMTHGLASDLATAVLLAATTPILVAPAMNWRMWEHPATQRNVTQLTSDGVHFIGPEEGDMACGEEGLGRMSEPPAIIAAAEALLAPAGGLPLSSRHVLVTAGPTFEPIDPVRFIGNRSSGKQGYAIAAAAAKMGARTTLISGPGALPPPAGVNVVNVDTAEAMLDAVMSALPADAAIFAAAVADWRVADVAADKIKKTADSNTPQLSLVENPDILKTVAQMAEGRPRLVAGFAAETADVISHATDKRMSKGCDWIIANDVSAETGVFGGDENTVHLITPAGVESWPQMTKDAVAGALMERIAEFFTGTPDG
jgi:phosphopantothenoylcysteine decarboxylase/phosphopantothenate--cysteine ligase